MIIFIYQLQQMPQRTLRITLKKIKVLNQHGKYSKITISLMFGKTLQTIPNPRFLKNSEANFYGCRLHIPIDSQQLEQDAKICVYGIVNSELQVYLGKVSISLNQLTVKKPISCNFNHNNFNVQYQALLLKDYRPQLFSDDELTNEQITFKDQQIPITNKGFKNRSTFTPKSTKEDIIIKNLSYPYLRYKESFETNSDSIFQKSVTMSPRRSLSKRNGFPNFQKTTENLELKLMEPITHSRATTIPSQNIKKNKQPQQKFQVHNPLEKSRCHISEVCIPFRTIVTYVGVCLISFILGIIIKQEISS